MDTELERLQKEINGKVVVYTSAGVVLDAILLWPPKGEQVSVKPYGHSPEEIATIVAEAGHRGFDAEYFSRPEFCLAALRTGGKTFNILAPVIAEIEEGSLYDSDELGRMVEKTNVGLDLTGPSCPYG